MKSYCMVNGLKQKGNPPPTNRCVFNCQSKILNIKNTKNILKAR